MLGDLFRHYRQRLGLSQEELAERVTPTLSVATIRNIERGRNRPYRHTLIALCAALALTPEEQAAALQMWRGTAAGEAPTPATPTTDQMASHPVLAPVAPPRAEMLTVLVADLRDYTAFTQQQGAAAGAALTARFPTLAAEAVQAEEGRIVSAPGDEVLAVFVSTQHALRAAVDLLARCAATMTPLLPLRVGVGLDVGEPIATPEGGLRGEALDVAGRLCAQAGPGEILASETVVGLARRVKGLAYAERGVLALKGLSEPIRAWVVRAAGQDSAADLGPPLPPAGASPPSVGVLPTALTPLLGREHEEAAMVELLRRPQVRLVTMTGPGGVGKTRLAQQVAATLAGTFAHGTVTVSLAALRDPDLFLAALAQALGVQESGGQSLREQLMAYLQHQERLLLLDNFEQLTAAAPLLTDLLGACSDLKALVTSRVRLRMRGEHEFVVPPLALPDPNGPLDPSTLLLAPAVALFVQRAQAYRPAFTVDAGNAEAVAGICRRLDGLPLALELASARLKLFSPQALLARLGDRLALLTGGAQDAPERHQTLRATLAWSYDLLPRAEQVHFRRLGIFAGGCTLEAAEVVLEADPAGAGVLGGVSLLDGMTNLVDQHLVQVEEGLEGEPRFTMLETIREYALERLAEHGEVEAQRWKHAAYYRQLAEEAEAGLRGPKQIAWFRRLDRELDNIRGALAWALERGHVETALGTATPLALFWFRHGHLSEGRMWLRQGLTSSTQVAPKIRADALAEEGWLAWAQGDWQEAMTLAEEGLAIARGLGEKWRMADALNTLGAVATVQAQYEQAAGFYQESLALHQELGDQRGVAVALSNRGQVALYQGDLEQAAALLGTCLIAFEDQGERWYSALTRSDLGSLALAQGDDRRAAALYAESLAAFRELGDMWGSAWILEELAEVAHAEGEAERAIRLSGAAASLREVTGSPLSPADRTKRERVLAAIRTETDAGAFATAWEQGRGMTLEEAIAYALKDGAT